MQAAFVAAGAVDNGTGPYRIVLRYYDPIQITYNIKYPAGDNRGEWTGPEDVPIGGVGTPGTGKYDIDPYLATQIYCVDPFTPFHSRVPNGNFEWNGGAMADTVSGYVEAAPWNMSGAMQAYGEAVQWIAANGYRGIYGYNGGENQESWDSIDRLKLLYPAITPIDKEIAVMATKVAIWKTVAGDSVQVLKTTLDNSPTRRAAFDALVNALVEDGKANRTIGAAVTTAFDVKIGDTGATYDETTDLTYNYYGPMTVKATLKDTDPRPSAVIPPLDKVFLTVSGPESTGVMFVDGSYNRIDGGAAARIYGTEDSSDQYFSNKTFDGTGTWTSPPFYMAIPKTRTDPPRGDELLVRAMAGTLDVPVRAGTPVVFAFQPAGTSIQDWDAIQAFIGGASEGKNVSMYAEDNWYTGFTTLGDLQILKQVENFSSSENDQEFTFAVYYCNNNGSYPAEPVFATANQLNLTDFPVRGAYSVNAVANTFTLKNGSLALIQGLPMEVDLLGNGTTDYEYYYWVEEITDSNFDDEYESPHIEIKDQIPADYNPTGPFQLYTNTNAELALVTATNTRKTGSLTIKKKLAGSNGDWGVDESTMFSVRVKDVTNNNYLLFKGTGPTYECYGNSDTGDIIKVSAGQPVTITNLWTNIEYDVEEIDGPHYDPAYGGNGVTVAQGPNGPIKVINTYDHGTGDLVIRKALAGFPEDWGVDETTVFSVRIKDATNNNYLLFTGTGPNYTCIGNSGSGDSSTGSIIKISAGQPATITNLWANVRYEVEEISGANYAISYQGNGALFAAGANSVVTVTNTYVHGTGDLVINKKLAGSYSDWGVDEATVFSVRIKDATNNKYLLFTGDGPNYTCTGNNGSGDSSTGGIIKLSAGQPTTISNLWANVRYEVEEISGAHYDISYQGNNVMFAQGQNSTVTVINTYEHGTGNLVIHKHLSGNPEDWGVDDATVFTARVKDSTGNNYVLFDLQSDGKYRANGNNNSAVPTGDPRELVQFTADGSAELTNLWVGRAYKVEETDGNLYTASYEGNNALFSHRGNTVVTVDNTYKHGTGSLIISKLLAGSPGFWNVNNTTVFTARVKDVTGNNYLLFERQQDGTYLAVGNNNSPAPTNDPRELVQFTAGSSAELKGLWSGRVYKVEETQGGHYTASYQGNNVSFPESGNMTVVVTNTFDTPDTPDKPCLPLIPFIPFIPFVPIVPFVPCIPGLDLSCITKPKTSDTPQPIVTPPKTGDSQLIAMIALLTGMVCLAGIVVMMAQRKKEEAALAGAAST